MNKTVKIFFSDFWPKFNARDNFFTRYFNHLLGCDFDIVISKDIRDCDFLIYSCFGDFHRKAIRSKTKKIFYTGENIRPNFSQCDSSITFDFDDYRGKNVRIPLWYLYVSWFGNIKNNNPSYVISYADINGEWFNCKKEKECCTVFSSVTKERIEMIDTLSRFMPVDGFGKNFNNYSKGEKEKYKIISKYKSSICFENSFHPGYVTEKLLHARSAGNLAIYWGHNSASYDFNPNGYINAADFKSLSECAEYVAYILQSEKRTNAIVNSPIFSNNNFNFNEKIKDMLWK